MSDVNELLTQRQKQYDCAYAIHGEVLQIEGIHSKYTRMMLTHPHFVFPWAMILNKLIRILATPDHLDSWKDIAGYAQLVINEIKE